MRKKKQTPALKPYMEAVRAHCQNSSKEELIGFVCELAQEISPQERAGFLEKFRLSSENAIERFPEIQNDLPSKIEYLKEEIMERQRAIDDGSFHEEHDNYGWGGYDDMPDSVSEDQKEELGTLFAEADSLFLSGNLEDACEAYGLLLEWFHSEGESDFHYDIPQNDIGLNWREIRARHCRCVYEILKPKERVGKMIHAMDVQAKMSEHRYAPSEENHPSLRDVFDARPGVLKDWEAFLKAWTQALEGRANDRAFVLFLEGICWMKGLDGVPKEVRNRHIPMGYLYWLDQLVSSKRWTETVQVAHEALEKMPNGELRAQAGEILTLAGERTKDPVLKLKGKREQFCSTPQDSLLGLLIEEAARQQVKEAELERALRFLGPKKKYAKLRVKILLMLGRVEDASKIIKKGKALGWGYDETGIGVFFGGVLLALTHASPEGVTIQAILKRYVTSSREYSFFTIAEGLRKKGKEDRILQEIVQGLSDVSLTDEQKKKWLNFTETLGGKRIDAIVSNKHRKAYARAAQVLGSLMEGLLLNDDAPRAKGLLNTYRNEKYNRFSAFRREVDSVLRGSAILRPFYKR